MSRYPDGLPWGIAHLRVMLLCFECGKDGVFPLFKDIDSMEACRDLQKANLINATWEGASAKYCRIAPRGEAFIDLTSSPA